MKIKFKSDDNLPLNKPSKFHNMTITIKSVFKGDGKFIRRFFYIIFYMNYVYKNARIRKN